MLRRSALVLAFLLGGCTTNKLLILPPSPDDPVLAYVNAEGASRSAFVRSSRGTHRASSVSITTAELRLSGTELLPGVIPVEEVESIHFRSRSRGALNGAVVGLAAAGSVGLASAVHSENTYFAESRVGTFVIATGLVAIVTVPAGALLGALIGHRITIDVVPVRSR